MGFREQFEEYNIITDEDTARGIIYAWALVLVADTKIEQDELKNLEDFARLNNISPQFKNAAWLSKTVDEALGVYKAEGAEIIFTILKEVLGDISDNTKRLLLYSLMQLAAVDGDFDERELDALARIVETLEISKRDTLMMGMLNATYMWRTK
ncbi:MAG: hypothetical protein GY765_07565 [bacterium]|nr:hypothetical protein [bacterium]